MTFFFLDQQRTRRIVDQPKSFGPPETNFAHPTDIVLVAALLLSRLCDMCNQCISRSMLLFKLKRLNVQLL